MGTSLLSATPRTQDVEHGRARQIHTYFTFFQLSWTSLATDILLWSSSHCFFVFLFLPLDTNQLRGESSFRPEPLRKPPYEPSRVDIQFYYNFKQIYTDIRLELPKDDQVLLLQGFNDVLSPKRDDGKRFSSTSENLKNGSPDQKSRCRTCAQACYSPFKYSSRFPTISKSQSRAMSRVEDNIQLISICVASRLKEKKN